MDILIYRLLKGSIGSEVFINVGALPHVTCRWCWCTIFMISLLPTEQFINFFSKMNILFLKKENTLISFAVSNSSPIFFHLLSFLAVISFPSLASSLPDAVFPSFFFSFPLINHFHHFPFALSPCSLSSLPFFFYFSIFGVVLTCCSILLFAYTPLYFLRSLHVIPFFPQCSFFSSLILLPVYASLAHLFPLLPLFSCLLPTLFFSMSSPWISSFSFYIFLSSLSYDFFPSLIFLAFLSFLFHLLFFAFLTYFVLVMSYFCSTLSLLFVLSTLFVFHWLILCLLSIFFFLFFTLLLISLS